MLTINPDIERRSAAQLHSGGGQIVVLDGDTDWREAAHQVRGAVQVDIHFPSFKDGRGFTLATQLRQRLGYDGHLRATGDLIPDQAMHLKRVGFDAIEPDRKDLEADWAQALQRFAHAYQPANDRKTPISILRHGRAPAVHAAKPDPAELDLPALNARFRTAEPQAILRDAVETIWQGRIAMLSSFGAEAAVGLHMLAQIDRDIPVLFLDTQRHFAQTEQYRDQLADKLGLTNIRLLTPDSEEVAQEDADNRLWSRDADACCALRKVRPLDRALGEFDALITGRKRFHGGTRINLPAVEKTDGRVRINPLANWSAGQIDAYFERYDLPRHPLTEMGYASIGCWTCTAPASDDGDLRSGRWAGQDKNECGIHLPHTVAAE